MSHKATNWAIEQRGLKPIAKVLLWRLADRHNPDYGCFPDQASLAHDCEISRASVNRYLNELEERGLIRREQRIHPDTKKQMNTRYVLAFEDDFGTPDVASRVSDSDTENEPSRVSENAEAVSQKQGVAVSQSCETLTSKGTSNLTGNALRAASERVDFDLAWKAFPHRPMPNRTAAVKAWDALSDEETVRCFTAIKRFARWHVEDSEARGVDPKAQLEFRPGMGRWIGTGAWVEALTVPLKSDPVPPLANGLVVLTPDHPDFIAVERLRGRKIPLGQSGRATFRIEEIEQARAAA
ncbi:helix-turn-helix domain-containing protein [Devosia sp.]|uniref:helix-turn-helix domain-containing protein n=1 Tax=Devosia sp. TaxID=1871048 RepID=UPI002AFFDDFC|nr:helix-turn-helix domain-containing protein [Devosia sp.]